MKIILSSRGIENENVENAFLKLLPKKKKLSAVIITTASVDFKEKDYNAIKTKEQLNKLNIDVTFLDIEFEKATILKQADIIYLNGGNPYYLLHFIKEKEIKKHIEEAINRNTILIGSSAGAFVLTKTIEIIDLFTPEQNTINLIKKNALNFLPFEILPHFDKYVSRGIIKENLVKEYEQKKNINIIKIKEKEAYIIDGNKQYYIS